MAFIVIARPADLLLWRGGIARNEGLNPTEAQTELTQKVNDAFAMKNQSVQKRATITGAGSRRAAANLWLVGFVAFILAATVSLFYWRHTRQSQIPAVESVAPGVVLSETTAKILAGLESPVDLRFFAPADVRALPEELGGYLNRVETLLAEYERVAAGKVRVRKNDPQTDAAAKVAAGAAGVVPFASANGEIIYLGLTVGAGARIESIAPLAPEWEAALESDVSRAIARVTAKQIARSVSPATQAPVAPTPIDPALSEELLRTFPDLATQSFEAVAKVMRERTLEEFKIAAAEMQTKVAEAQKALAEAQANKSEAAVVTAQQELRRIQAEQSSKLNGITANLQERIAALQQLKTAPNLPAGAR